MEKPESDEQLRLDYLKALRVLDTEPEEVFDRLTRVAASICETPVATISLVDENRQWFKSVCGLDVRETTRSVAFCDHTIRQTEPLIVTDTTKDPAFRNNPLVTGHPALRFYAGFPLLAERGVALGALAVMDFVPRVLDRTRIRTLMLLAEQVVVLLELRRQRLDLQNVIAERDRMNVALARQTQHLREAQRIAGIGSWELLMPSRQLVCSEEIYRIFGLTQTKDTESYADFLRSVHADDRARLQSAVDTALRERRPLDVEHRIVRPGGEIRCVHERAEFILRDNGEALLAGTAQDVTEQRQSQERLALLRTCVARVNDTIMITEAQPLDEPGPRIVFINEAFKDITGYSTEEVIGRSPRFLQGPKTNRSELDRIRSALRNKEPVKAELTNYAKDGKEFWVEMTIAPVTDSSGATTHFVSVQRDITQRKAAEAQIERLAFFDPLTHLPNRRLLLDRLHHAIAAASRSSNIGALLFIDLDNFKTLNDTLGHDKGDLLLVQVARRLERSVRRANTVARLGGDEFVILLEDLSRDRATAAARAEVVSEKILARFQEKFLLGEVEHQCSPSIGVALFDHDVRGVEDLLKRADLAMYQAKASGRNTACFFDPEMQAAVNARVALEREFREGLARKEFVLHFQPQTDYAGRTMGAEVLIRWQHPRRGMVYPQAFIGLAEETGLIVQMGQWVLQSACNRLAAWSSRLDAAQWSLSVNISASQFRRADFVDQVLHVIDTSGANPQKLKLELTESVLVENQEDTIAKMARLKKKGIAFSLDDFGTGYSSLSYLKRLPLDELKIDQSFVRDVLTDANDAAIARTIVALGKVLGLNVIAEGVETEAQRDFLAVHGCHAFQGYFFSPPLPAEQL